MSFAKLIEGFKGNHDRHARLVNTMSLMEYIGARKILKSQDAPAISEKLLSHVSEEIRHAQTLKRLALRLSDGHLVGYHTEELLGGTAGSEYMQAVDRGAAEVLASTNPWQNYLYTTWLVEERAKVIYPIYEDILAPMGFGGFFRAILRDEEKHLAEVSAEIAPDPAEADRLRTVEAAAYDRLLRAWLSES